MDTMNSLDRLIDSYCNKVIMGEKGIDPEKMVRDRCRHCCKCGGSGCPEVMADLPAFKHWIRIDRFVGEYMKGLADLAKKGDSPGLKWLPDLAIKKGMGDILDDCVKSAAEQEVSLRSLIHYATAADSPEEVRKEAREKLLKDIYRWLRPQVSGQLTGGNYRTLKGRVSSNSIMGEWTIKFLKGLKRFNQSVRIRRKKQGDRTVEILEPFPPEQLVGNFLNFMAAQKQFAIKEGIARVQRHDAASLHGDEEDEELQIEDEGLQPDEQADSQFIFRSLTDAVKALPQPHRTVVLMLDFEGKSVNEVVAHLQQNGYRSTTNGSVKGIHARAKKMLKKMLVSKN